MGGGEGATLKVFISYRRSDVSGYAGRITDALVAILGIDNVFQDVATVVPGADFEAQINRSLAASDAVLAIIGSGWLEAATADGRQRLLQDDDLVRMELTRALTSDLRVVPVLVGGAVLPSAGQLPEDLKELARRQAVILRDETFHQDLGRLLRSLRGAPTDRRRVSWRHRRSRVIALAVAFAALIGAGGATWSLMRDPTGNGSGSGAPTRCPATGPEWQQIALATRPTADLSYGSVGSLTFTVNSASWRLERAGQWQLVLSVQMLNSTTSSRAHAYYYYRSVRVARRPFEVYCFTPPATDAAPREVIDAHVGFNVTCQPVGAMAVVVQNSPVDVEDLGFTKATAPADCALQGAAAS